MLDSEKYCSRTHKWFGAEQADKKRSQTKQDLENFMNKKYVK
jgi:hypothetical protein